VVGGALKPLARAPSNVGRVIPVQLPYRDTASAPQGPGPWCVDSSRRCFYKVLRGLRELLKDVGGPGRGLAGASEKPARTV
jgi:hypothetical protein